MKNNIASVSYSFSPHARYLKASLIQSSSGRYFVAVDGQIPPEAVRAEFNAQQQALSLRLANQSSLVLFDNIDAEFGGRIAQQDTISIVQASDNGVKVRLPLVTTA